METVVSVHAVEFDRGVIQHEFVVVVAADSFVITRGCYDRHDIVAAAKADDVTRP